ncbi:ninein-like protein [Watersipora subatra]|uniref:ninein-like protein n=1 Tax=Watersipora subatra TaxID=2589382 RepID=UPI00355B0B62
MGELGVHPLSVSDNSGADVYEGEGLLNKSMGTPGPESDEDADIDNAAVLREIWTKQGVGKDGYLSVDEFGAICENMGLDKMSDKDLHELFDKLDADNDGRIGFEEFVAGLTQRGGQDLSTSRPHSSQGRRPLRFGSITDPDRMTQTPSILSAITGSGYFSCIDSEATGYAKSEDIIEFWESFGIAYDDVIAIFDSLAFDVHEKMSLQELSSALEQELLSHDQNSLVYQAAIYSCRHELRYIKGLLETNSMEMEKLLEDMESCKKHNAALIKEADERLSTQIKQHEVQITGMERRSQEQLRSLHAEFEKDRELLTAAAQTEKAKLESEVSQLKEEERILKKELVFHQREMENLEKDLHSHIEKNSGLAKDNQRLRRELSALNEMKIKMEERETHRTQLTDTQHRFTEQKILSLENENKALRDREDELVLELEEVKTKKSAGKKEGRMSRRGSLLSDYTMMKKEETGCSDESAEETEETASQDTEDLLKLEILKLKDEHSEEILRLKKVRTTETADLQDAFKNELMEIDIKHKKAIAHLEEQVNEEKLIRSNLESDWRKKNETEKAQLKLSASRERMELMKRLQEENRDQMVTVRRELLEQHNKEFKLLKEQHAQEKLTMENRFRERIEDYETMFDRGANSLRGKLQENFYQLVEEQAQNEIEIEKRHMEATYETERNELFELLNKEKHSLEDQFNSRLYALEDEMDDIEENVRADCEEEFWEQLQEVQHAFDEERANYDKEVANLKAAIASAEKKDKDAAALDKTALLKVKEDRDRAIHERDEIHHEKTKIMLEKNQLQREHNKTQSQHKQTVNELENRIGELQKLSAPATQLNLNSSCDSSSGASVTHILPVDGNSSFIEEKKSLEAANALLTQRLEQSDEQLFEVTSELQLQKSHHEREVSDLKLSALNAVSSDTFRKLQEKFDKERKRCQELEKALSIRSTESGKLLRDNQEDCYKKMKQVEFERDEYETKLLAMRKSLAEVTERLKQQVIKSTKSDNLVRELYIENSDLVEALYVTEKRQKGAERREMKLQVKCDSLGSTFNKFMPAALEAVSQG